MTKHNYEVEQRCSEKHQEIQHDCAERLTEMQRQLGDGGVQLANARNEAANITAMKALSPQLSLACTLLQHPWY